MGGTVPGGPAPPAAVSLLRCWSILDMVHRGVEVGVHLVSCSER